MKASKNFSHRNLDGLFRIMLLTYGEKKNKKICVKIYAG